MTRRNKKCEPLRSDSNLPLELKRRKDEDIVTPLAHSSKMHSLVHFACVFSGDGNAIHGVPAVATPILVFIPLNCFRQLLANSLSAMLASQR
jgi:hypothetical protein